MASKHAGSQCIQADQNKESNCKEEGKVSSNIACFRTDRKTEGGGVGFT